MGDPGAQPLRILHAPRNIANQASDVVAALRRAGHHAEVWESTPDPFGPPSGRRLTLSPLDAHATLAAITDIADGFDVVHFHFGRTLVPPRGVLPPFWDLPVLRALGLRVYFTFHGSDVRIDRIHRERNPWSEGFSVPTPPEDDRIEKSVQVFRTYANRLFVVSVNYLAYVPDATYLPRVIDLAAWPEVPPRRNGRPLIVHAPTRRGTKGTELLLAVLDGLREEGLEFDLRLLEGVPHHEVRSTLAKADILVDNLVAGSYGIVSLEAMASSAVAVSNMSETLRLAHPDAPVVPVDPATVRDVLRDLIRDPGQRLALAERGRPYVTAVHDAAAIAARLVEVYREPAAPFGERVMPDWMSMAPARRVEALQGRVQRLETELAATRRREVELRMRLGLPAEAGPSRLRQVVRRVVPLPVRRRFAHGRR